MLAQGQVGESKNDEIQKANIVGAKLFKTNFSLEHLTTDASPLFVRYINLYGPCNVTDTVFNCLQHQYHRIQHVCHWNESTT